MDERSIRDIIREEWKKLSALTWGQRFGYIWDYYKPLMVAILCVIAVISIGVSVYRNKQINHLLNVYMVNCAYDAMDPEAVAADFGEYIGGLGVHDEITIDTSIALDDENVSEYSMAAQMKVTALTAAGDMDVVLLDRKYFERYRDACGLMDLSKALSEEQLAQWADRIEYGKDEETGEEIPAGLNVKDAPLVKETNLYYGEEVYAVLMASAKNVEMGGTFLTYLMEGGGV